MDQDYTWGTDIEMLTLSHLLQTPVLSFSAEHNNWQRYSPHDVDRTTADDMQSMSLYLMHTYNHFNVVCSVTKNQ
jgi:hypothetical protein